MNNEKNVLFLQPLVGSAIWGDGSILSRYPVETPDAIPKEKVALIGIFSGHPQFSNRILNGAFRGMSVAQARDAEPGLFGPLKDGWDFLSISMGVGHAAADLSIQVHPQEAYALKREHAHGKSECWYIVDVDGTPADVILGHTAKTMAEFKKAAEAEDFQSLLLRSPIRKGSFFNLLAGTLHAIQKGTTFLEICSASDLTYRLYDYHRRTADGIERTLQKEKFYDNVLIPYEPMQYHFIHNAYGDVRETILTDNENFSARLFEADGTGTVDRMKPYYACFVTEGNGTVNGCEVSPGTCFVVTGDTDRFSVSGKLNILAAHG
ncbi:MAG: class I mannose-6-phosphate isomerase [Clostridiales Family XIII bacterium]|jgi:mannose-6-phosphate isomerase|nr:class I mannose-6-phosphate isomerase [Clostridiales Family XIII bacterium]